MSPAHPPMPLFHMHSPFVHSGVVVELQSVVSGDDSIGSMR